MAEKKVKKIKKFPNINGNFSLLKSKKTNKDFKINKNMNFVEIMKISPEAGEVLFNNGMHCIGCGMAMNETLEQGAWAHGLNPDKLVDEINKKIKGKKKK